MTQLEMPFPRLSTPATLADAFDFFHDANSDHPRRSAIRSAIKTMGKGIGLPLDQIPAGAGPLRELLATASPGRAGVKPTSWKTLKSEALRALQESGVALASGRDTTAISAEWQALIAGADKRAVIGLGRFLKFLTRTGVEPGAIGAEAFAAWQSEILDTSLRANPQTSYRQMVRLWKACEQRVDGWPRVEIESPEDPRRFSLPWEAFPQSLSQEVRDFLRSRLDPDLLSPDAAPKVRPDTNKAREKNIRAFASALVLSGELEIEKITSLGADRDDQRSLGAILPAPGALRGPDPSPAVESRRVVKDDRATLGKGPGEVGADRPVDQIAERGSGAAERYDAEEPRTPRTFQ